MRYHAQHCHFKCHQFDFKVGDFRRKDSVFQQWLAIFLLLISDALQKLQFTLRTSDFSDAGAFMAEQILRVGPSLVFFTDQVFDRHFHVIEEHFIHFMIFVQHDDRSHGDAGRMHVDQQEGDSLLLARLRISTHQAKNHVGMLCQRDPCLLPVDDVMLTLALRARLQ